MKRNSKLRCAICGTNFTPKKFAWRQRVCSRKTCQSERHRRNCQAWRESNPGYFRGEGDSQWAETRQQDQAQWRMQHPDYQSGWREKTESDGAITCENTGANAVHGEPSR